MSLARSLTGRARHNARSSTRLLLLIAAPTALAALGWLAPRFFTVSAAATPTTGVVTDQLIMQEGSGVPTAFGDFIASTGAGGLNSPYRYYIEVPPGVASLQVDLFDRDVGGGGGADATGDRDRDLGGGYTTCARYQLFRPDGTLATTAVYGINAGGSCPVAPVANTGDNVWNNFSTQAAPAAGHWEIRVDMSSAVTTGNDVNAYGIRAHDGTPGAGGTELNVYAESFYIIGVNQNGRARTYSLFPYITSGCVADANDFDFDSDAPDPPGPNAPPFGSLSLVRRGGGYTHTNANMSTNDTWQNVAFTGWTNDQNAIGYGLWTGTMGIQDYGLGNYGPLYIGSFAAANPPPTSQPQASTFRMYLPTDGGAAPVRPYVEQLLTVNSLPNPPQVGQTTRMTITVRVVNPAPRAITFSAANVVTANVPGAGALYAGNAQISQGTLISQPAVGGTGNVVWNPGAVAAGATVLLSYQVNVTPTAAGQRIPVTGTPALNGTTARFLDDTGNAAQARATYTFGPLCELAAQQGILTHALISSFRAFREGGGVRVAWETATEVGTTSFTLYRYDPGQRKWEAVNDEPLLASPGSPQGARYELEDPGAPGSGRLVYALLERSYDGREMVHGAYAVQAGWGRRDSEAEPRLRATRTRLLERLEASSSRRPLDLGRHTRPRPIGGAIQIAVREQGLYYLDAPRIAELMGMPVSWVRTQLRQRRLSLSNLGRRVAWHPATEEGGLYFYGEGLDSPYTDSNVYWLEPGDGLPMETVASGEPDAEHEGATFTEVLRREEDRFAGTVASRDPDSDFWFWDTLHAGDPVYSAKRFEFLARGVAPTRTTASIEVELQGATNSGVRDEHRVLVSVNGVAVGESRFSGLARHQVELAFPQSLLAEGTNEVELTGLLDEGVAQSIVYVDSFALRYSRYYLADGPALFFGSENYPAVSVDGFPEPAVSVLDLSDPLRPAWVEGAKVEPSASGYRVRFSPPTRNARHLAVTPSGVKFPFAVTPDVPSRLRSNANGADYLIIAPEALARGALELARYRRGKGLQTAVVLAEDIMDEFNYGIRSPHALRDFLGHVHRRWRKRPRFVVLIGKGTFDYKDILGEGDNRLPPLMASTDNGLFASDVRLADVVGDDGVPEFAIGRLPALNDEEVAAYVSRIRDQETASPDSWVGRVLFAADRPQGGANFHADAEALAGLLPPGYRASKVYLSDLLPRDQARQLMFGELEEGVAFMTYVGHGALDRLSGESLLTVADVKTLDNRGRLPVITTWTCNAGRFDIPGFVSLGEELVLGTDGGASAVWAPTGLSDSVQARWLAEEFFRATFQGRDERLGDALRRSLKNFERRGGSKSMLLIYQLLGDPALQIRRPESPSPE